jgi:hypothetical protein
MHYAWKIFFFKLEKLVVDGKFFLHTIDEDKCREV